MARRSRPGQPRPEDTHPDEPRDGQQPPPDRGHLKIEDKGADQALSDADLVGVDVERPEPVIREEDEEG